MKSKSMHRQFYWDLQRPSVDKKSLMWFFSSRLKGEKESFITKPRTKHEISSEEYYKATA